MIPAQLSMELAIVNEATTHTAGDSDTEPASPLATISRRRLWLILAGIPTLYWINGFMPWSYRLFVKQDHDSYLAFMSCIVVLHWTSLAVVIATVRRSGAQLSDIGVFWSVPRLLVLVAVVGIVGGGWIAMRSTWPATENPESWQTMYPWTMTERWFFVFVSLTAGICEEVVYRGFAIRALQARGMKTWQALAVAALSFVLVHGLFGVFMSPLLVVAALIYSGLFLRPKSLTPGIYVHALFDVMAVAAV